MAGNVVVASPGVHLDRVRDTVDGMDPGDRLHPGSYASALAPVRTLGPACLFYGTGTRQPVADVIGPLASDDPRVRRALEDASEGERNESGLDRDTTGIHLALDPTGGHGAVCGWAPWPHDIAQIGVLTADTSRRTGCGRRAALQTLAAATDAGLLPQWRAAMTNEASIALALSLGLTEVGWQFSLDLGPEPDG